MISYIYNMINLFIFNSLKVLVAKWGSKKINIISRNNLRTHHILIRVKKDYFLQILLS